MRVHARLLLALLALVAVFASSLLAGCSRGAPHAGMTATQVSADLVDVGVSIDLIQPIAVPSGYPAAGAHPVTLANFRDSRVSTAAPNATNGSVEVFASEADVAARVQAIKVIEASWAGTQPVETDVSDGVVLVRLFGTYTDAQIADYRHALTSLPA